MLKETKRRGRTRSIMNRTHEQPERMTNDRGHQVRLTNHKTGIKPATSLLENREQKTDSVKTKARHLGFKANDARE